MIRVVTLTFKPEHVDDFLKLFEQRKQRIRDFEGCYHLQLWQDKEYSHVFYTYSLWHEAHHLELYRVSDLFQETWSTVKQWFQKAPQAFSANAIQQLA